MSNVNHPDHYNLPGKKECIEQMIDEFGKDAVQIFDMLNAYKYAYRAGHKEGNAYNQDMDKANWYIAHACKLGTVDLKLLYPVYKLFQEHDKRYEHVEE